MKSIHKFQQCELYHENETEIMRDNIADEYVIHTMTSRVVKSVQ